MMRLLIAGMCFLSAVSPATAEPKELQALQDAVRKVIDDAEPSIACILVSRSERYREFGAFSTGPAGKLGGFDSRMHAGLFGGDPTRKELIRRLDLSSPDPIPESYGSGVVIEGGQILTHFHVVQNATKIFVRLPGKKGSYADIYAADGRSDLAVLKLIAPPADLKPIRMGDGGKVRKGDFVVGIANPFAAGFRDGSPTASHGIVGNLRRRLPSEGVENDRTRSLHYLGTLMQTDLRLNLGCSGGAVLTLDGELIGLTSSTAAIVGGETPGGFAVPMSIGMKRIIDVLRRGEEVEYGLIGVGVDTINPVNRGGAVIDLVSDGTPAKRAGLQVGEIITAIDDIPIRDYDDLSLHVGTALAGSEVTFTVQTFGGRMRKVTAKLAKYNYSGPSIAANRPPSVHGLRVDYGSIVTADVPIPEGVYIRDVERGSAAEKKYKDVFERARWWIVTNVNGKAVSAPADFYREAAAVKGPLELRIVEVVRNPEATARTLTLP